MAIWSVLRYFGIFYGKLVYFVAIWYILWPFGIFRGHLVYGIVLGFIFSRFGMLYEGKSCNPDQERCETRQTEFFFSIKEIKSSFPGRL
jgi:hypothetical protein